MVPYGKRDLKSHHVPSQVYQGNKGFEIHSYKLCHILAELYHWDLNQSYRIRGWVDTRKQMAIFILDSAKVIDKNEG